MKWRDISLGVALGVVVTLGLLLGPRWYRSEPKAPALPTTGAPHGPTAHRAGEAVSEAHPKPRTETENTMVISPERLQAIGVRFQIAKQRPLEKVIRTVGRVEIDERRLARLNVKIEGWIEELLVGTTGERVSKDQVLFTLYSPELVATQEEYLLALRAARTLGKSEFPEVAQGAKSLLLETRRRLELWDIRERHVHDLERSGKVQRILEIHAPFSGTVINKVAVAGLHVSPGDELYTIADLSQVWVIADIYEYELPLIRVGHTGTVSLSYAPDRVLQGRISFIYPTVDPETRTAKVRFEVDNPSEVLKPGMYANVALEVPLGERLAVPRDAVLETGERRLLFIHHGGGRLEWREAEVGVRSGDWVEVIEGLQPGEHIVTSANFLLDSESQLRAAIGGMKGMKH